MKEKENKAVRLQLRVTAIEAAEIGRRAEAARLTVSAFCRAAALGQPTPARLTAEQLRVVAGVASNLNQLTRSAHSGQLDRAGIGQVVGVLMEALTR